MSDSKNEARIRPEFVIERQGKKAVLYAGLLHLAHEEGLQGITVTVVQCPSDLNGNRAVCLATVQMRDATFTDVGDADATNVTPFVIPHILRMAATRAKARALRDALDIGFVAAEELLDVEALGGNQSQGAARRPSVAVQGGQRVDEDAGRGTAAPRPAQPGPYAPNGASSEWPGAGGIAIGATPKQRETLHKFGHRELPDDLTRARASEMISDAIARKGGA